MKDVESEGGKRDWCSIQPIEESLIGDNWTVPAIVQLDGSVYRTMESL
jgi:hypothetical protein